MHWPKSCLREIEPVVGGEGKPEDYTEKGWGVVIDTIEIQEVRVLSETVFAAMQAPYRAALELSARSAKADADRDIATREADCARLVEEARLQTELSVREKRAEIDRAQAEAEKATSLREVAIRRETEEARLVAEAEVQEKKREIESAQAEAKARDRASEIQRAEDLARVEVAAHALLFDALGQKHERMRLDMSAEAERRRTLANVELFEARGEAEGALADARAERERAEAQSKVLMAENLPKLAAAVGQKFGDVKVTHIGNGESPFGSIAQAVASVLELARQS